VGALPKNWHVCSFNSQRNAAQLSEAAQRKQLGQNGQQATNCTVLCVALQPTRMRRGAATGKSNKNLMRETKQQKPNNSKRTNSFFLDGKTDLLLGPSGNQFFIGSKPLAECLEEVVGSCLSPHQFSFCGSQLSFHGSC
jgi:hypothetical protein